MLRSVANAPPPSTELAAFLATGFVPAPGALSTGVAAQASRRRWRVRTAAALAVVLASLLGAASANALPAPVQGAVAEAVAAFTPFVLPRPAPDDQQAPAPVLPSPSAGPDRVRLGPDDTVPSTVPRPTSDPRPVGTEQDDEDRPGQDATGRPDKPEVSSPSEQPEEIERADEPDQVGPTEARDVAPSD